MRGLLAIPVLALALAVPATAGAGGPPPPTPQPGDSQLQLCSPEACVDVQPASGAKGATRPNADENGPFANYVLLMLLASLLTIVPVIVTRQRAKQTGARASVPRPGPRLIWSRGPDKSGGRT